ncbi:hypothetical protein [Pseudodesulfovibrio karagichevae]|uniref:Tetratricopeptide repeat-containing protein n=1 Tax=Pseudodesulfovibrio karagichevae TaxID=3239305 RepID=A0ABV4K6F6_9BACT
MAMKKVIVVVCFVMFWTSLVFAEDKIQTDPFDLSASTSKIQELGVPTKTEVDNLEKKATDLFNAGEYREAIPALIQYSKRANWLANIISSTLEPYYSASYDDRKHFSSNLSALVKIESTANSYKRKRNIAIAMHGECLMKLGDTREAIPVLINALNLISIDNDVWWKRTRENLLNLVGVDY